MLAEKDSNLFLFIEIVEQRVLRIPRHGRFVVLEPLQAQGYPGKTARLAQQPT